MGKSLNNVVTPDDMCERYGADTFRMYEMGMGPMDMSRPWQTRAVVGSLRYLQRLWRLVVSETTGETIVVDTEPDDETLKLLHRTIDGVSTDYVEMAYNTAIAKLIVLTSHLTKSGAPVPRSVAEALVLMTAPLAPHISEEMWQRLGHSESLAHGPFPVADPALLVAEVIEYPIQVKGKVRARITVAADASVADVAGGRAGRTADRRTAGRAPRRARSSWCRGRWCRSSRDWSIRTAQPVPNESTVAATVVPAAPTPPARAATRTASRCSPTTR